MSHDSAVLRRLAHWGATRAPLWFVHYSPLLIGVIFFFVLGGARRAIRRNQRLLVGRQGFWRESWEVMATFVQFAHCFSEALAAGRKTVPWHAVRHGDEELLRLLGEGKGVVLVTAHAGPWDSAASQLAHFAGRELILVMGEEQTTEAAAFQDAARRGAGLRVVRLGTDPLAALPVLSHLEAGGLAGLQLDRAPAGRPARVESLFGEAFPVPVGPFLLASLAQVPLMPVFMARTGFFSREVFLGRAIRLPKQSTEQDMDAAMSEALAQMETHLRRFPRQWFHFVSDEEQNARVAQVREEARSNAQRYRRVRRRPQAEAS